MNWVDVMTNNANLSSRDRKPKDPSVLDNKVWASWDPHEIWLTRIRQPRELAARQATDDDCDD